MINKCSCAPTVEKDKINFGDLSLLHSFEKFLQFEFWIYKCEKCNVLWLHQWHEHDTLETLMSGSEWGEIKEYICQISNEEFTEIEKKMGESSKMIKPFTQEVYKLPLFKDVESLRDRKVIILRK
jgi:hypothetical protein